ncbi:MAG: GTP-binding protein, partial [Chloroflexota bacterium]|nr:GTP-binding protein [Chloroflexota bacterium]
MQEYLAGKIRNVVLVGHGGSGKTSLAEVLAHTCGASTRLGKVDEGNTISDYDEEEIKRKISINTSLVPVEWQGHKINILDTPGYADFVGEILGAVRVADAAIVVVDAVSGVQVGTELVWQYLAEAKLPRLVLVNKMDRENVNPESVLAGLREAFGEKLVPFQLPLGVAAGFSGVVDLLKGMTFTKGNQGNPGFPAESAELVAPLRQELVEMAAEADDELLMKYLEGEELAQEEMAKGLREAVRKGEVVPVAYASSLGDIAIAAILNYIAELLPAPGDCARPATDAAGGAMEL